MICMYMYKYNTTYVCIVLYNTYHVPHASDLHSPYIATPPISATLGISRCIYSASMHLKHLKQKSVVKQGRALSWNWIWALRRLLELDQSRGLARNDSGISQISSLFSMQKKSKNLGLSAKFHAKFHHSYYNFLSRFAAQCLPHEKGLYTIRIFKNSYRLSFLIL